MAVTRFNNMKLPIFGEDPTPAPQTTTQVSLSIIRFRPALPLTQEMYARPL